MNFYKHYSVINHYTVTITSKELCERFNRVFINECTMGDGSVPTPLTEDEFITYAQDTTDDTKFYYNNYPEYTYLLGEEIRNFITEELDYVEGHLDAYASDEIIDETYIYGE